MTDRELGSSAALAIVPAHTVVWPGLMIVAATYGLARYSYGLFLPVFAEAFDLSTDTLGFIASGSYAGYMAATLLASWISAIVGPRLPIVMGGVSAAVGMILIALADGPAMLTFGVVIAGTSPGLSYPPLSDAVMRLVRKESQNRAYTVINSGTSLGVIVAGPLALWAGTDWRWAWMAFAVFALVATLWNARVMPSRGDKSFAARLPSLTPAWFFKAASLRLFAAALILGLATSVYWTFSVELIVEGGGGAQAQLFWVVIGIAGFAGASAGDLTTRIGLRMSLRLAATGVALAITLLAFADGSDAGQLLSAMLFGATFILTTGLLGVWSVHVFHDRPSAGFGATFFLITLGQLISPSVAGITAASVGLEATFWVAAGLAMTMAALVPAKDIRSMSLH